jgi:predicted MFS family arabinose efflux permease
MLRVLRQRSFALLWVGGLISMTGDWFLIVGLPVELYRITGSTLAVAGVPVAFLLPSILLGSVAGVYVDRWDRRRLMVVVNVVLAVLLLPLLGLAALGPWIAYVVLFAQSSVEQLFTPAAVAIVPSLLEGGEKELVTANALTGVSRHLSRLVGPAIAGVVVAVGGLTMVAILDAASFLIAAGLIALIRYRAPDRVAHATGANTRSAPGALSAWRRLANEWRDGLRVIVHAPVLRALLVFLVVTAIGEGLTITLFVPWVVTALHSDSAGYGALLSAQAVGGLAGALVIGRLGSRVNPLKLLIGGAMIFGVIDLGLFTYPVLYPHIGPALVVIAIVGIPGAAIGAGVVTLEQSLSADSHRGRVVGTLGALGSIGSLAGAILAGVAGEVVPAVALLVVQGSGYVIGGSVVWLLVRRRGQPLPAIVGFERGAAADAGAIVAPIGLGGALPAPGDRAIETGVRQDTGTESADPG